MARNAAIEGEDSKASTKPVYVYRIDDSTGTVIYLTNYPSSIAISSVPAHWTDAGDPQTFLPGAVSHGRIERKDGIDETDFEVQLLVEDGTDLSRFVLFGIIPKILVEVIKVTPGAAAAGAAVFDVDCQVMQSGLVKEIEVVDYTIKATCTPEPFLANQEIPRWRFTRVCNHELYGEFCGVDKTLFQHQGAILALDIDTRTLTIAGDSGLAANFFRLGFLQHAPSGMNIGIFSSSLAGGNTLVTLHQWLPDFAVTDNVTAFAGCNHTIDHCRDKFSNDENFGGFPLVPNKNPTIHGAE
jgi:hypothetical protein